VFVLNPVGTYFGFANQQARVDVLSASSDPFSVGEVLLNVFQTNLGDPVTFGYSLISLDLTALLQAQGGNILRLRFAEVDNQLFFKIWYRSGDSDSKHNRGPRAGNAGSIALGLARLGLLTRRRKAEAAAWAKRPDRVALTRATKCLRGSESALRRPVAGPWGRVGRY
jgi:hypothetical protein